MWIPHHLQKKIDEYHEFIDKNQLTEKEISMAEEEAKATLKTFCQCADEIIKARK